MKKIITNPLIVAMLWLVTGICAPVSSNAQLSLIGFAQEKTFGCAEPDSEARQINVFLENGANAIFSNAHGEVKFEHDYALDFTPCHADRSVKITATDQVGKSVSYHVVIHVRDTEPPVITDYGLDKDIHLDAKPSPSVITALFDEFASSIKAEDQCSGVYFTKNTSEVNSGTIVLSTTVSDDCGNEVVVRKAIYYPNSIISKK